MEALRAAEALRVETAARAARERERERAAREQAAREAEFRRAEAARAARQHWQSGPEGDKEEEEEDYPGYESQGWRANAHARAQARYAPPPRARPPRCVTRVGLARVRGPTDRPRLRAARALPGLLRPRRRRGRTTRC